MTYKDYISNILKTRGRFNCGDEYHERHHIIPRCMGGSDEKRNLIDLYPKEHFIAHKLLAEEHPYNFGLVTAYHMMAFVKKDYQDRYELTPEEYEEVKLSLVKMLAERYKDKTKHPNYNKHLSEETKRKISEAHKGKHKPSHTVSAETRKKIGDGNRNPSPETRKRMSEAQKAVVKRGRRHARAKKVIRVSDNKIYQSVREAAEDNHIKFSKFNYWMHKGNDDFKYYEEQ